MRPSSYGTVIHNLELIVSAVGAVPCLNPRLVRELRTARMNERDDVHLGEKGRIKEFGGQDSSQIGTRFRRRDRFTRLVFERHGCNKVIGTQEIRLITVVCGIQEDQRTYTNHAIE
jgi:hypothetical protein